MHANPSVDTAHPQDGGREIQVRDQPIAGRAGRDSRAAHQQRNPHGLLHHQASLVAYATVRAHCIAVVGGEHDQRGIRQPEAIDGFDNSE